MTSSNHTSEKNSTKSEHTFTFSDEQLLCLQVCLQNAPTPYHISKKKIVGEVEDIIGKPRGNDFKEGTITLPLIHALGNASSSTKKQIKTLLKTEWSTKVCDEIVQFVHTHDGISYARNKALVYAKEAKMILRKEPETVAQKALLNLVDYAIERDR